MHASGFYIDVRLCCVFSACCQLQLNIKLVNTAEFPLDIVHCLNIKVYTLPFSRWIWSCLSSSFSPCKGVYFLSEQCTTSKYNSPIMRLNCCYESLRPHKANYHCARLNTANVTDKLFGSMSVS